MRGVPVLPQRKAAVTGSYGKQLWASRLGPGGIQHPLPAADDQRRTVRHDALRKAVQVKFDQRIGDGRTAVRDPPHNIRVRIRCIGKMEHPSLPRWDLLQHGRRQAGIIVEDKLSALLACPEVLPLVETMQPKIAKLMREAPDTFTLEQVIKHEKPDVPDEEIKQLNIALTRIPKPGAQA